jgi:Zn-dependent peptidase ImmA (M78 family)
MSYVQLARAAAEKLVDRLGIRTLPIDVEQVASALHLRIVVEDLGNDVSGLLVSRGRSAGIAVKRGDAPVRQRFTIAHEIGHFVLGHHLQRKQLVHADQHHQVIYRSQSGSRGLDPLEVQANQFAASLLMPAKLVRDQVERLQKPMQEADVSALAREFKVSEQAMTIRLTTLSLL